MVADDKKSLGYGLKYNSLNGTSIVLSKVIRGLVIPKILSPIAYGLFSSVSLFTRYLNFFDLGATTYFTKEVAKLDLNNDALKFHELTCKTFSLLIFGIFLSSMTLMALGYGYSGENEEFYKAAIFLLVPIYGLTKIREFFIYFALATGHYRKHTVLSMLVNYTQLIFVSVGVYFYAALGGVFALLCSEVLLTCIVGWIVKLRPKIEFSISIFKNVKAYRDQYFLQVFETFSTTIDQALMLLIFGPAGFGVYIFGLTFAWLFEAISEVLNNAFYPKVMMASLKGNVSAINLLQQSLMLYFLASILIVPGAIIGLAWVVLKYFTAYQSGLEIFVIILFFGITRGGLSLLKKGYIAVDKEILFIKNSAVVTIATILLGISAFVLQLPMQVTIYFLAGLNLLAYIFVYLRLVSPKNIKSKYHIFLVFGLFCFLNLAQLLTGDSGNLSNINILLIVAIVVYCLFACTLIVFRSTITQRIENFGVDLNE